MLGAIIGDVIGSAYEYHPIKTTDFPLFSPKSYFTDDTVLTVAVADCILQNKQYAPMLRKYGQKYPDAGYGVWFADWIQDETMGPYNSFGNGSAMRVSPIGFAFQTIEEVLDEAKKSAEVTHNHPEGIKGAQAATAAVFFARKGCTKEYIKDFIEKTFGYDLSNTIDEIRPAYTFDITCQGTVPQAVIAFLESSDFEDAIRKAVSLGGDSDTLGAITGGIAQAFYREIPDSIVKEAKKRLDKKLLAVIDLFHEKYCKGG